MKSVRNTLTGKVASIRADWVGNPAIAHPDIIVAVEDGSKSYAEKTYKPRKAKEFTKQHPEKVLPAEDETPVAPRAEETPNKYEE